MDLQGCRSILVSNGVTGGDALYSSLYLMRDLVAECRYT